MKALSRVVWSEGMYLAPHHFQRQARYFEDSYQFATSSLWFKAYGLAGCAMDSEALQNGTVSILHARGVFPDGLPFEIPGCDAPPAPRAIDSVFSPTRDTHVVLLGIPAYREDGRNVVSSSVTRQPEGRYVAETRLLVDDASGIDEKPVELGRKNMRLLLETEATEDLTTLPIARIRRDGSGRFVYDPAFIPPLLRIGASDWLMTLLGRLCEILDEKSRSITAPQRKSGQALADYYRRDLLSFWILHTIHSSLGGLRHQLLAKNGHPEELYTEMARLGGALCCFALDAHPAELPLYQHDSLSECFEDLDQKIRAWLELMMPTNCVSIPLSRDAPYFWKASILDARYLHNSSWIFEISAKADAAQILSAVPRSVKVCSEKFVGELVRRGLPGLTLTHLPAPPPAIPAKVEAQYFGISKSGGCWEHITQTKQIGVYASDELPDAKMQIHIIVEN